MKTIVQSLRMLFVLTVLTGVVYPVVVTGIAQVAWPSAANGSIVSRGSKLLAQHTEGAGYFWPRPSAADYGTVPSGASNRGPTSAELAKTIAERRAQFGPDAPDELLTASGSGLDPHLSPAAARSQAARVAAARRLPVERVLGLIQRHEEGRQLGFLGEPRVNVLTLNLALDAGE